MDYSLNLNDDKTNNDSLKPKLITFIVMLIICVIIGACIGIGKNNGNCDICDRDAKYKVSGTEYCSTHYSQYLDKAYERYNKNYYKKYY